jgi:serine/threonine-protein kinase
MPPPNTVPELIDRVRRSGIVPTDRLDGFLVGLQTSDHIPLTPLDMLDRLVEAGMITRFHADRLAAGKYKGFQLGSYLILDQIGTGGMGQVYLAEHTTMRRLVALKVLPPYHSNDPVEDAVARERFFREARAAGTLDHPNIVRIFDLCQEGRLLFLVMEYVDGVSLQNVVSRYGPLPVESACHYARQVAFGLQHAFELGFVHRDIKPANLLLDAAGVIKILDFGLVRSESEAGTGLTKQLDNKRILGTADYVAPEQAVDSSRVDIRADLYSLGATLYYLLAGRPLFPDGRTAQKLVWQQIKDPVPINRLRPEAPPILAEIVHRLLQKKPADRYQTPLQVFEALAPLVPDQVPPPDSNWLPEPPARVVLARAAAPGPSQSRVSGSTSQILAAAMRASGSTSNASLQREPAKEPASGSDSDKLSIAPPALRAPSSIATNGVDGEDTQRVPENEPPVPAPPAVPAPTMAYPHQPFNASFVIGALAMALLLSLLGIIILLLRGNG